MRYALAGSLVTSLALFATGAFVVRRVLFWRWS